MKKWMTKMGLAALAASAVCAIGAALAFGAPETKYAASLTSASPAVTFAPGVGRTVVRSVQTSCDVALGTVTFWDTAGGRQRYNVSAVSGSTSNVPVSNVGYGLTNGDSVVYVYASGATPVFAAVDASSTTNVVLSTPITAPVLGDAVYEVAVHAKITVAGNSATNGTNVLGDYSGDILATPGGSPLYVTLQSNTNTTLSVTVEK